MTTPERRAWLDGLKVGDAVRIAAGYCKGAVGNGSVTRVNKIDFVVTLKAGYSMWFSRRTGVRRHWSYDEWRIEP